MSANYAGTLRPPHYPFLPPSPLAISCPVSPSHADSLLSPPRFFRFHSLSGYPLSAVVFSHVEELESVKRAHIHTRTRLAVFVAGSFLLSNANVSSPRHHPLISGLARKPRLIFAQRRDDATLRSRISLGRVIVNRDSWKPIRPIARSPLACYIAADFEVFLSEINVGRTPETNGTEIGNDRSLIAFAVTPPFDSSLLHPPRLLFFLSSSRSTDPNDWNKSGQLKN